MLKGTKKERQIRFGGHCGNWRPQKYKSRIIVAWPMLAGAGAMPGRMTKKHSALALLCTMSEFPNVLKSAKSVAATWRDEV